MNSKCTASIRSVRGVACIRVLGTTAVAACSLVTGRADAEERLIAVDWSGSVFEVDQETAELRLVTDQFVARRGNLEFGPGGFLYSILVSSNSGLNRLHPSTGQWEPVGGLGFGINAEGGLAFAPDGTAWGIGPVNTSGDLYQVDLATGEGTVVAPVNDGVADSVYNGLAYRDDGMLVGIEGRSNSLFEIDPRTGDAALITTLRPAVGLTGGLTTFDGVGFMATASEEGWAAGVQMNSGPSTSSPGRTNSLDLFIPMSIFRPSPASPRAIRR